jgi:glycosyltransferase involved in cell wall biosynthesis
MARIATISAARFRAPLKPCTMDTVRWMRISEALARLGHEVDIIVHSDVPELPITENLRYVDLEAVRWSDYAVVKTLFHSGFDLLEQLGGSDHPFIISKLGSVVGSHDDVEGVYFFGDVREKLFATQQKIASRSRMITILTEESVQLWSEEHGRAEDVLLLPTGVDAGFPRDLPNPYAAFGEKVIVYIGNLYDIRSGQRTVNVLWQTRLTAIGRILKQRGIRLVVIGPGESDLLDPEAVTYLGPIDNEKIYAYKYHASAGLVLAQGSVQHNESSKIYEYLRSGLPVVSEAPVPNNAVILQAGLGYVADFMDDDHISSLLEQAVNTQWDRQAALAYMVDNHTWDKRVSVYHSIIESRWRGLECV